MLVVVLICAAIIPREACSRDNARLYDAHISESPICGFEDYRRYATNGLGPDKNEYMLIKCKGRP
jgi:hypothetical protein